MRFSYVYILQSEHDLARFYTGLTDDLKDRLGRHNRGEILHTSKFRPWRIKTAIASTDRNQTSAFERYLKKKRFRPGLRQEAVCKHRFFCPLQPFVSTNRLET